MTDTEIDWETYIIQVQQFLKGERDYSQITGPTGPLVYPAGHLYIHTLLERITNSGSNIGFAQQIYALLKRLHSIYVLRLFNDCWSVVAMQCATLAFQSGNDDLGIVLF
ncbi:hypothetical protein MPER_10573, partial [Moniliophthora perniciosa FA553]